MSITPLTRRRGHDNLPPRKSDIRFHYRPTDRCGACGNSNIFRNKLEADDCDECARG